MRWSWDATARYLFQDSKFVISLPLNRYAIPNVQAVEYCPISNSIRISGEMRNEQERPFKFQHPIKYTTSPEVNPLVETEVKELR